ncbi:peptidase inhibitor family I36 protein [Nonomuraea sp. NPDC050547]|uniref:peptidase inhibitor family I36 protein n=1 Tax=Nonomuraea sp. NPDC050547 TaxID=3364368 RepID=UPI0037A3F319
MTLFTTSRVAAAALSLAAVSMIPSPFAVSPAAAAPICPDGHVCLYNETDFKVNTCTLQWKPADGVRYLESCLADNVRSFIAEADACFVDTYGDGRVREAHRAAKGDYSRFYSTKSKFGRRMNRIDPGAC